MRFSLAIAALVPVLSVFAADHAVTVGAGGLLAFNPTSITAAEGDTVTFSFQGKNHSVSQSTFTDPCALAGVDSGFHLTAANSTDFASWQITINNASTPLWFFCAQNTPKNHCQSGMVFAVNPTAAKSFDAYLANAQAAIVTDAPAASASSAASSSASVTPSAAGALGDTVSNAALGMSVSTVGMITVAGLVATLML